MKNSVKKVLNVICMVFVMWFVSTLLFGCSNGQELDNDVMTSVENLTTMIQEQNEGYDVKHIESMTWENQSFVRFTISSKDSNDIYVKYVAYYDEKDCDALYNYYKQIFDEITNELRVNADYEGDIELYVESYDGRELLFYSDTKPETYRSLYYFEEYLREDVEELAQSISNH